MSNTSETSAAPVSVAFISSIIADIAALETQDCAQATAAFDDFNIEELASFTANMRKITNWLTVYKKKLKGPQPNTNKRDRMRAEKREAKRQKEFMGMR